MQKEEINVLPASDTDLPVIVQLAKSFDLDCEAIAREQFIVVKRDGQIIGFGRLRNYPAQAKCTELATIGVITGERKNGIGSGIVKELVRQGPDEIFVTCVIPEFFSKFGFQKVKEYPSVLQKKVDFCKSYDFCDEQIFVMKITK